MAIDVHQAIIDELSQEKGPLNDQSLTDADKAFLMTHPTDLSGLQDALDQGANVNATLSNGMTMLHRASMDGLNDTVSFLGRHGANVNAKDQDGQTPLHVASFSVLNAFDGNTMILDMLVNLGADINAQDLDGKTPLHCAANSDNTHAVDYLTKQGANPNIKAHRDEAFSPLHHAIAQNNVEATSLLIEAGADVNAHTMNLPTPLHTAVLANDPEIAGLLMKAGADPSVMDANGETPIECARDRGREDVLCVICDHLREQEAQETREHLMSILDQGHDPIDIPTEHEEEVQVIKQRRKM